MKQNTQQVVQVPVWLQKRMRFNLKQAAKNKVCPSKAKRAKTILKTISNENKTKAKARSVS